MANIIIYSKEHCGYCEMAKSYLQSRQLSFEEVRVDLQPDKLQEMLELSNRRTVPQIFINGKHIGGYDDLMKSANSGELDKILSTPK